MCVLEHFEQFFWIEPQLQELGLLVWRIARALARVLAAPFLFPLRSWYRATAICMSRPNASHALLERFPSNILQEFHDIRSNPLSHGNGQGKKGSLPRNSIGAPLLFDGISK